MPTHSITPHSMPSPAELELEVLARWKAEDTFAQRLKQNAEGEPYVIYDGPPTANAAPALHHVLPSTFKDVMLRYQLLRGRNVVTRSGWDTHGLPVEVQVERKLGLTGKPAILQLVPGDEVASIQKFVDQCREDVFTHKAAWEGFVERLGRWMPSTEPYVTCNSDYIDGVWQVFRQVWDKNLVTKSYKILPHCPRCGTSLSSAEVSQGYTDVHDRSLYVSFPLADGEGAFLAWTTTPWTLPGNVALAVHPDLAYATVRLVDGRTYTLAQDRLSVLQDEHEVLQVRKGSELAGLEYQPLWDHGFNGAEGKRNLVVCADFVTATDGTGIVHTAVMYGEDDYQLGLSQELTQAHVVGLDGHYLPWMGDLAGKNVDEVYDLVVAHLGEQVYRTEVIKHSYPHCWRCNTRLIYYAKDSWFVKVGEIRQQLLAANAKVNWAPEHIRDGRFGSFLEEARDWAISRERFWGTPLPVWTSETGKHWVPTSLAELREKAGLPGDFDPHRPGIDAIELTIDGELYRREPYVLDVWFDSGAMPYAAKQPFPADFIAEAVDQTRGWFYSLLVLGVILNDEAPYRTVACLGHIVDEKGRKMSKSKGNVLVPAELFEKYGADAVRWYLATLNGVGERKAFVERDLQVAYRKTFMLVGNVLRYLEMNPAEGGTRKPEHELLDVWITSRIGQLTELTKRAYEEVDLSRIGREVELFVDDLSTWYLRRSRGRTDEAFVQTVHRACRTLAQLVAPIAPVHAELWWQRASGEGSVHMSMWPEANAIDEVVLGAMTSAREVVSLGLARRAEAKQKVRQVLQGAHVRMQNAAYAPFVQEELNVLDLKVEDGPAELLELDLELTPDLLRLGLQRDLQRLIQDRRRQAGCMPADQVQLVVGADHETLLRELLDESTMSAVGVREVVLGTPDYEVELDGQTVTFDLRPL